MLIPAGDFANELNVYLLLVRAVYNKSLGHASMSDFTATCDQIRSIFNESAKVDQMTRSQFFELLHSLSTSLAEQDAETRNAAVMQCIVKIRSFLIDFMVNVQE